VKLARTTDVANLYVGAIAYDDREVESSGHRDRCICGHDLERLGGSDDEWLDIGAGQHANGWWKIRVGGSHNCLIDRARLRQRA
jgi:hypothetical protein